MRYLIVILAAALFTGCAGGSDECDADADGWDAATCGGEDCDDGDEFTHPDAGERCDGIDNNCNGWISGALWDDDGEQWPVRDFSLSEEDQDQDGTPDCDDPTPEGQVTS